MPEKPIAPFLAALVITVLALLLYLWRGAATPYAFSDQDLQAVANAAWSGIKPNENLAEIPRPTGARAVILAFYRGEGQSPLMDAAPAGANIAKTLGDLSAELSLKAKGTEIGAVSVHFALEPEKILIRKLAEAGYTYQVGLNGLLSCSNGDCRALPGPFIHARSLSFDAAVKRLTKSDAPRIKMDLSDGLYRFADAGVFSPNPDKKPARLYRASTLTGPLNGASILDACRLAGDYLVRMQRPGGRWNYQYDSGKDRLDKEGYNLLRHAGTTYALYQLSAATGDARYAEAADQGIEFLKTKILAAADDPARMFVVEGKDAKLGGAGLALMAFVEKAKARKLTDDEEKIAAGLARHCILSQNPDGSFESYFAIKGKKAKGERSIYYPGEAMLGLIRYYQIHPERKDCLESVRRGAEELIGRRWNILGLRFNVPPDAWLMLALEELHEAVPEKKYAEYCFDIATGMGSDQWIKILPQRDFRGGYFPFPPQVTPAGSRMEGITAAWLIAKRAGNRDMMARLEKIIRAAASFQIGCMIRPEFAGLYPNPAMALGAFRESPVENLTRIDYDQHNISGLLVAARILD